MQRPSVLRSNSDGRFVRFQRLAARGLGHRLKLLKESWSNDSSQLEAKQAALALQFEHQQIQASLEQANALQASCDHWDNEIDHWMGMAERETLLSIRSEKESLKKLRQQFADGKLTLRKRRDDDLVAAEKHSDGKRTQATTLRDGMRSRIEGERYAQDVAEGELNSWFAATTGRELVYPDVALSADRVEALAEAQDFTTLAKKIDQQKAVVQSKIQAIQTLVQSKNRGRLLLTILAPVLSAIIAGIAWALSVNPLFVAVIFFTGAIAGSILIYTVLGMYIGKAAQALAPELYQELLVQAELFKHGLKLADGQHQRELKRLSTELQSSQQRIESAYEQSKLKAQASCEQIEAATGQNANRRRWEMAQARQKYLDLCDKKWAPAVEQLQDGFSQLSSKLAADRDGEKQNLVNRFLKSQLYCADRWREGAASTQEWMDNAAGFLERAQPDWSSTHFDRGTWKRDPQNLVWKIGHSPVSNLLSAEAVACNPKLGVETSDWPVVFDLMYQGALIIDGPASAESAADDIVTNLLLRAATSTMPGTMRFTIIDPQGLGKKYSWLMSLADIDPSLVGDRVWTQPVHIADQLANISRACEDIIQQSLRDNYSNLYEYNEQAGPMAVPYRLIVWDQFPSGLDESSWSSLCSILAAGGRCGVGVILRLSQAHVWPSFADPQLLAQFGLHLTVEPGSPATAHWKLDEFVHAPIYLHIPPSTEEIRKIMDFHQDHTAQLGRVIVPFSSVAVGSLERQSASSASGLQIPVGIASSGRSQQLKLGEGTAQHVLVAGKTGSGKSSLLHTLITSAALKYSPKELRLVLLDFKKGVEFQVYAENRLSHADVIGIESKREFGVSTLEYVDRVMHARGELFRSLGVQDVPSLHKKEPTIEMPRILIVIDEFQELFVEDDKLAQQASLLMDRIVRQGRSFGVHLVLASQTLGGAYSLPRTTLAQMAVRIALQCDSSDAMLILGEDNTAAERLRFSGQAIYNDAGGRIENNQGFQVAYADKECVTHELKSIPSAPIPLNPAINPMGRQVIFEGHRPALWDDESMTRLLRSEQSSDRSSVPLLLGDSVSIDPPIIRKLARVAGRNLAIVGPDDRIAASMLAALVQSMAFQSMAFIRDGNEGNAGSAFSLAIDILDGTRAEEVQTKRVIESLQNQPLVKIHSNRHVESLLSSWSQELAQRLESPLNEKLPDEKLPGAIEGHEANLGTERPTKILCIANLARFRELRKGDEFGFGDSDSSERPDAILANLLKDGPAVGLHLWIWSDSANTLGRWLSRQSMRELELRVLMQMSANDSNQLIDSNAANKLESNLVVFQDEMDGRPIKFRPFAWDTLPLFKPR